MTKKKKWTIIGIVVALVIVICGGTYYHMSHAVAQDVPGHVYRYQSVSGDKVLYLTFAPQGNKVVLSSTEAAAKNADQSQTAFNQAYVKQSKNAKWEYKAKGSKLTLAKINGKQVSQWQYNSILATKSKFTSRSFTYQIAKAGQGKVNRKTTFLRVDNN